MNWPPRMSACDRTNKGLTTPEISKSKGFTWVAVNGKMYWCITPGSCRLYSGVVGGGLLTILGT